MSYLVHTATESLQKNLALLIHEFDLFLGVFLFILGFFGFESDKYCDGNTADYLSCTRPTTYYFFDSLDMALITLGAFFILFWALKRKKL